jgi:chromosomal replication initiator protein
LTNSERDVVAALEQMIAQRVGDKRYDFWFARNTKLTWEDDQLVVGVPNHFFQEWLQNTFAAAVRAAASEVLGRPMAVRFVIDPELFRAARQAQAEVEAAKIVSQLKTTASASAPTAGETVRPAATATLVAPRGQKPTRRWHRLADFVVGSCNRVAHASAVSVVEAPGQMVNPLVLHGPVGTGKSHLLEGIYAGLRKQHPELRIVYATSEDFTNRFVQSIRLGKLGNFRRYFRECDAFLVDDLQFLASKPATREEFLHTFDSLLANGRQVVLSCDCHPRLAGEFSPELIDRLLGGAVWGLSPPEFETRLDLLRAKAACQLPAVPDDVLRFIAEKLCGNVRELEGALHSVRHLSRVTGRAVDLGLAREALGEHLRHAVRVVQVADIDRAVCQVLRLESGALQARKRAWAVSHPRMLAIYLCRKHTNSAYSEIGRYFGGRNHSTAVAAEKKIRQWLEQDGELVLGDRHLRVREVISLVERDLGR